ncbi:MAG: hypothetical protein ACREWE_13515 [Gammaproteobacteria bacterium]
MRRWIALLVIASAVVMVELSTVVALQGGAPGVLHELGGDLEAHGLAVQEDAGVAIDANEFFAENYITEGMRVLLTVAVASRPFRDACPASTTAQCD